MLFLWVKTFHIVMVTSWFAGLFYLPRIFVNIAMVPTDPAHKSENDRLLLMANKLFRFMTPLGVLAVVTGLWLWLGYHIGDGFGWIHAKVALVLVLIGYHLSCRNRLEEFNRGERRHSHVWYRWYNEIPVVILLAVVALVVIKPF
ncbi:MAG: CopD family protein [Burkholderiaceae bacterium]|nr:CopD family protein [Burkholderiaceae bacterium]